MSSIVSLTVSQNLIRNLEKGYMQFPGLSATDMPRRWHFDCKLCGSLKTEKGYMQFPGLSATDMPRRWHFDCKLCGSLKTMIREAIRFFSHCLVFSANRKK